MKSNRLFDSVKIFAPKRNKFDLGHEKKLTCGMGDLIPVYYDHVLPGDKFRVRSEIFMRSEPLLTPIMTRVDVTMHYFFVPYRLLWNEWEDFITRGASGEEAPVFPKVRINETNNPTFVGSLADYFGVPYVSDSNVANLDISALPFRAYQLIFNEYYRDQNLSDPIAVSTASGVMSEADSAIIMALRKRAWTKDYFTSALPFAQRGPAVTMPIEGTGSVTYKPISEFFQSDGVTPATGFEVNNNAGDLITETNVPSQLQNIDEVILSQSTVTINQLRITIKIQEWMELAARVGSRYAEQIRGFFGVTPDDARLQRPEYLGGGKNKWKISEVLSTFEDQDTLPQGNMSGHAYAAGNNNSFTQTFKEHGMVIGLMSTMPQTGYNQGLSRFWEKFDTFDHYFPQFANLGEQEVKDKEIYLNPDNVTEGNGTFGYQSRYAEYKFGINTTHGYFKAQYDYWHMDRIFSTAPALDEEFVTADPTKRIYPAPSEAHHLLVQVYNKVDALRPMPYFGVPTL